MPTATPATMEQIAPAIAAELGDDWSAAASTRTYDDPWAVWYLTHTDGTLLRLRLPTEERLFIQGDFPDAPEGLDVNTDHLKGGHASADPARPARAIAGQIRRAVLPVLEASLATFQQRIDAARRLKADKETLRAHLATIPGFDEGLYWQGAPRGTRQHATKPSASVSVNGDRYGAYVGIELRGLSADQAERVLRALTVGGRSS